MLYGIPCVGKSTLAVAFAARQSIRTVIQTDYVRELQRQLGPPDQAAALANVTHDAWQRHGPPTQRNIEAGFLDHVEAVAVGIHAVARKVVSDGFDAVIEGAHFHGGLIAQLRRAHTDAEIHPTLLVVGTAEELRRRVRAKEASRGQGAADKQWQERVPIMLALQDFLVADARRHDIPVMTADEWSSSWAPVRLPSTTSTTS
ncbi:AAA family ATPase [Actinosynnema sp. NPDC051121]